MSCVRRIIASARDLPLGGPLGALLDRAAWHMPTWHAHEAYHCLVRESHLDLVIAQSLPPDCSALATTLVASINAVYDRLAKARVPRHA